MPNRMSAFEGIRRIQRNYWFAVNPNDPGNWPATPWMGQATPMIQPELVAMDLRSQRPMELPAPARGRARRGPFAEPPPPPPIFEEEGSPEYSPEEYSPDSYESGMYDTEIVSMQLEGREVLGQQTIPVFNWPGHTAMVLGPSSWGAGIGVWPGTAHAVGPMRFPPKSLWF